MVIFNECCTYDRPLPHTARTNINTTNNLTLCYSSLSIVCILLVKYGNNKDCLLNCNQTFIKHHSVIQRHSQSKPVTNKTVTKKCISYTIRTEEEKKQGTQCTVL